MPRLCRQPDRGERQRAAGRCSRPGGLGRRPLEQVLAVAARLFAAVSGGQPYDVKLARETLRVALRAVPDEHLADYPRRLSVFAHEHQGRLGKLYQLWGPNGPYPGECPLVESPAHLVLCERDQNTALRLAGLWDLEGFETTPLDRLTAAWRYGTHPGDAPTRRKDRP